MSLQSFRIREIEDKMRDAALKMDYENAIVFRDQAREMRAEIDKAAAPEAPKIVNLKTRDAHIPPEVVEVLEEEELVGAESVPEVIDMLNDLLERATNGEIQALVVMGDISKDGVTMDIDSAFTDKVLDHVRLFVGGLYTLANDLLAIEQDMSDVEYIEIEGEID